MRTEKLGGGSMVFRLWRRQRKKWERKMDREWVIGQNGKEERKCNCEGEADVRVLFGGFVPN